MALQNSDVEEFRALLARLDSNETEATKKYQHLRENLVRHCFKAHEFLRADELADQTLDILARKLSSEDIVKLDSYAYKILDNLLLANQRRRRPTILLSENTPAGDNPERTVIEKIDGEKKVECFLQCVGRLNTTERWLLFAYNPHEECDVEERRRQIAIKLGIGAGTLRTRMTRLRTRISRCFRDCVSRGSRGPSAPRQQ
jgi:DNA-directed RNA polymerase specialized sigma24 family protein